MKLGSALLTLLTIVTLSACGPARVPVAEVPTVAPSATPTPQPTPTDAWWDLRQGDGETRRQGDMEIGLLVTPSPSLPVPETATRRPPTATPPTLSGKILFLTDREGTSWFSSPAVWMMDADGNNQWLCPDAAAYDRALEAQRWSPDHAYRVFVGSDAQIHVAFPQSGGSWEVSKTGRGIAYDPAWSPVDDRIAFVSNESGAGDEIYVIRSNGDDMRRLTYDQTQAWDKFPTWSPDGARIAFWSSRTGNRQIWVMNADGSEQRNLSQNGFNDFEPVWVR